MKKFILHLTALLLPLLAAAPAMSQQTKMNPNKVYYPEYQTANRVELKFPKVNGLMVLSCDFHTHTMFSDGLLWPTLRVHEAWRGGLDAIAITDHIEYRPHKEYLNCDHNTSFNIAKDAANELGFMIIKGTEITRKQAVLGHFNALFITDANPIAVEDPKQSILEAKRQNAFIIWNHPGWAVDSTYIKDFQADLFKDNLIDGIEVFNNHEFYPRVLSWAVDKNLTIIAATDVHGMVEQDALKRDRSIRPVTLVLASERSVNGIREGLDKRRTLALFHNTIAAKEDVASAFAEACISVQKAGGNGKINHFQFSNCSDIIFNLTVEGKQYEIPAQSSIIISLPVTKKETTVIYNNIFIYENKTLARHLQLL